MFSLDSADSTPLYRQLYAQIREQILSGRLPPHFRLPSIRDMAAELATSRNTVEGAYQELGTEGYIYSKARSGYFVSKLEQGVAPALPGPPPLQDLHPKPAERYRYDFHPARLDPAVFPEALWRKCILESLRSHVADYSEYSDPQGEWGLRCNLHHYLQRSRGVLCGPEQIVLGSGLQQNLAVVAQLIRERHDSVAVENPGYHLPRDLFRNLGFRVSPVDVGPEGLAVHRLGETGSTVVYITPSHQMPLGHVLPVADRLNLIAWAEQGDRLIIEDDYDSELRYVGRPISSLQGLCAQGNIVYQGSFSKVFSPALRLSYMVLPQSLLPSYRQMFRNYLSPVPLLVQRAMILFMEQGHWERHIRRARTFYRKKHALTLRAIEEHFGPRAKIIGLGAGLHLVVELRDCRESEALVVERAKRHGARLLPFSDFHGAGRPEHLRLLIGFGGIAMEEIGAGVALLARLTG